MLGLAASHVSPVIALTPSGRRIFPVLTRVAGAGSVALTFDDGPDRSTEVVLKTLADRKATATFFVTGEQVERSPALLREVVDAGHEVGVHGYRHRHHLLLTPQQVRDDLGRARVTIEEASGRPATLFRPPHGIFSLVSWREADRHGWHRVLWSRWGKDWRTDATASSILDHVGKPDAGDIVLLHDSDRYAPLGCWKQTVAALPEIIARVQEQGLDVSSIGSMLVPDGA
jgi:peptidoglycan/xylan/chitin deacetylase (PgdA/CDA1 family)